MSIYFRTLAEVMRLKLAYSNLTCLSKDCPKPPTYQPDFLRLPVSDFELWNNGVKLYLQTFLMSAHLTLEDSDSDSTRRFLLVFFNHPEYSFV